MTVDPLAPGAAYGPACPFAVDDVAMLHRWDRLTFLHWPYDRAVVGRLLPSWLEPHCFDDTAWVSLVPFAMRVWTPGRHQLAWACNFWETNVRTYVRAADGRTGIWFFSLDASRLGVVATTRALFRLPYCWSRMRLREERDEIWYEAHRRWPHRGATSRVGIRVGAPYAPGELTERDHFLSARWVMFSSGERRRRMTEACHEPWELHRASVIECDDALVTSTGLPAPAGEPIVQYSPGVDVKIGHPRRVVPPA